MLTLLGPLWAKAVALLSFYEQALAIARELGYIRGEGNQLANMGSAWLDLGEPHRAIEFCEQALVISREIGDKRGEGANLGNQGIAGATLGELPRAIEHYEHALIMFREIGDKRGEGINLFNLVRSLRKIGSAAEKQDAMALAEEALAILKIIELPRVETVEAKLAEWQAEK